MSRSIPTGEKHRHSSIFERRRDFYEKRSDRDRSTRKAPTAALVVTLALGGCCLDAERNRAAGNAVTVEGDRVCVDSTGRGLTAAALICGRACASKARP